MVEIFPSLIAANLTRLEEAIKSLEHYSTGFHLDVMDFHFVPNLTFGPAMVNAIRAVSKGQLQVHLMVDQPKHYFDLLKLHAQDIVSCHFEAVPHEEIPDLITAMHAHEWRASIAINPETPLADLEPFLTEVDHILLMSVNPGFSGQKFIPNTLDRLKELVQMKKQKNASFTICLDGGITPQNLPELVCAGAQQAAVASAIFQAPDPIRALKELIAS